MKEEPAKKYWVVNNASVAAMAELQQLTKENGGPFNFVIDLSYFGGLCEWVSLDPRYPKDGVYNHCSIFKRIWWWITGRPKINKIGEQSNV